MFDHSQRSVPDEWIANNEANRLYAGVRELVDQDQQFIGAENLTRPRCMTGKMKRDEARPENTHTNSRCQVDVRAATCSVPSAVHLRVERHHAR